MEGKGGEDVKEKTCLFIGQRDCFFLTPDKVSGAVVEMIEDHGVRLFLNGGMGAFDRMCAVVVHEVKRMRPDVQSELIIPYPGFSVPDPSLFDSIVLPEGLENVFFRRAITVRNEYMIRRASFAVCFVDEKTPFLPAALFGSSKRRRRRG